MQPSSPAPPSFGPSLITLSLQPSAFSLQPSPFSLHPSPFTLQPSPEPEPEPEPEPRRFGPLSCLASRAVTTPSPKPQPDKACPRLTRPSDPGVSGRAGARPRGRAGAEARAGEGRWGRLDPGSRPPAPQPGRRARKARKPPACAARRFTPRVCVAMCV